jgi:membrane glycosyltransferase
MRRYAWHTAFGLLLAFAAYEVSFSLFAWMTPVIVGLILAIPLAQWSADPAAGRRLRSRKLLLTPEESEPPRILERANALSNSFASADPRHAIERLFADPALLAAHRAMLPQGVSRKRGDVEVDLVIGLAKLEDCTSLPEAAAALTRGEMMAVLSDARGLDRLGGLDRAQPGLKNVQ